ncbi:hypothetical protein P7C70_g3847, partial [Phenoliferia sp. Uapishka_3]
MPRRGRDCRVNLPLSVAGARGPKTLRDLYPSADRLHLTAVEVDTIFASYSSQAIAQTLRYNSRHGAQGSDPITQRLRTQPVAFVEQMLQDSYPASRRALLVIVNSEILTLDQLLDLRLCIKGEPCVYGGFGGPSCERGPNELPALWGIFYLGRADDGKLREAGHNSDTGEDQSNINEMIYGHCSLASPSGQEYATAEGFSSMFDYNYPSTSYLHLVVFFTPKAETLLEARILCGVIEAIHLHGGAFASDSMEWDLLDNPGGLTRSRPASYLFGNVAASGYVNISYQKGNAHKLVAKIRRKYERKEAFLTTGFKMFRKTTLHGKEELLSRTASFHLFDRSDFPGLARLPDGLYMSLTHRGLAAVRDESKHSLEPDCSVKLKWNLEGHYMIRFRFDYLNRSSHYDLFFLSWLDGSTAKPEDEREVSSNISENIGEYAGIDQSEPLRGSK